MAARLRGQYGQTLSFQWAESQSKPGQTTRKKKKGKSREPQLALQTSYQIGRVLQEVFLSIQKQGFQRWTFQASRRYRQSEPED
jgi:hypothetical protein